MSSCLVGRARQELLVLAVRSGHLQSSHLRSRARAGSAIWVACQTKLTFGRRARRLHQDSACGGAGPEDEAILRYGCWSPCTPRFTTPALPLLVPRYPICVVSLVAPVRR